MSTPRVLSARWWFRTKDGSWVIAQWPSPPLAVWVVLRIAHAMNVFPHHQTAIANAATGALVVWGTDELVRGVNPFRRLLGAVVLGLELRSLLG